MKKYYVVIVYTHVWGLETYVFRDFYKANYLYRHYSYCDIEEHLVTRKELRSIKYDDHLYAHVKNYLDSCERYEREYFL